MVILLAEKDKYPDLSICPEDYAPALWKRMSAEDKRKWYDRHWAYEKKQAEKLKNLPEGPDGQRLLPLVFSDTTPKGSTGTAVSFVRSAVFGMVKRGKRRLVGDEKLSSNADFDIYFTGYEVDQNDLSTFMAVCDMYREEPKKVEYGVLRCKMHGIIKRLGLKDNSKIRKIVADRLERLTKAHVTVISGPRRVAGTVLSTFGIDEKTGDTIIRPNVELQSLFLGQEWQLMNREVRLALGSNQLAMWLHAFYSSHKPPIYRYKVETLKELCRSQAKELRRFKFMLKEALAFWQKNDPRLVYWEIDEEDCVVIDMGSGAIARKADRGNKSTKK